MQDLATKQNNGVLNINIPRLLLDLKSIAPGSFEKRFSGMSNDQIKSGLQIALSGLSEEQVKTGINHILDAGWIPDPVLLRRWCLGKFKLDDEDIKNRVESFHGKYAALVNVLNWLNNGGPITNAEKEAYNRSYTAFTMLENDSNQTNAILAYNAFKDNYIEVVAEYAEKGIKQAPYEQTKSLGTKQKQIDEKYKPADEPSRVANYTKEQEAMLHDLVNKYLETGLTYPKALLKAMAELNGSIKALGDGF